MKLPRDVDARQLAKALAGLGYRVTRQRGSHIRLTCDAPTPHSVTVPNHSPIRFGTLNAIPSDVAAHRQIAKAALIDKLFG